MANTEPILTRENGTPIQKPRFDDYPSAWEYVRAMHDYRDEITRTANESFDSTWRRAR